MPKKLLILILLLLLPIVYAGWQGVVNTNVLILCEGGNESPYIGATTRIYLFYPIDNATPYQPVEYYNTTELGSGKYVNSTINLAQQGTYLVTCNITRDGKPRLFSDILEIVAETDRAIINETREKAKEINTTTKKINETTSQINNTVSAIMTIHNQTIISYTHHTPTTCPGERVVAEWFFEDLYGNRLNITEFPTDCTASQYTAAGGEVDINGENIAETVDENLHFQAVYINTGGLSADLTYEIECEGVNVSTFDNKIKATFNLEMHFGLSKPCEVMDIVKANNATLNQINETVTKTQANVSAIRANTDDLKANASAIIAMINSLANLTAKQIWEYTGGRNLTWYNQSESTTTINMIDGLANLTAGNVWGYSGRNLTYIPWGEAGLFVWNSSSRNLTYTNQSIQQALQDCLKDGTCPGWWIDNTLKNQTNGTLFITLTGVQRLITTETYRTELMIRDTKGMINATSAKFTLYDPTLNIITQNIDGSFLQDGIYRYSYNTSSGTTEGVWTTKAEVIVKGQNITLYEKWRVESSLAGLILAVTDVSKPDFICKLSITNDGTSNADFSYKYWLTNQSSCDYNDLCTIDSGTGTAFIRWGQTISISAGVSDPSAAVGDSRWCKALAKPTTSTLMASASEKFIVTEEITTGGGASGPLGDWMTGEVRVIERLKKEITMKIQQEPPLQFLLLILAIIILRKIFQQKPEKGKPIYYRR